MVREGLKRIIVEAPDLDVAGEANDAAGALRLLRQEKWDVVVLDISLPGRSGLEVLKVIKSEQPRLPVLVLSMHPEDQYAVRVIRAGASGYLTKENGPTKLIAAIRKVGYGGKYISDTVAERLAGALRGPGGGMPHEALSAREFEVLRMMASGKTQAQIAEELRLSVKTVATYRARILEKMNMKTTTQLIAYGIKQGLVA